MERGCVYVYVYGMGWESEVIYDIYTTYPSLRSKRGAFSLGQSDGTLSKHGD